MIENKNYIYSYLQYDLHLMHFCLNKKNKNQSVFKKYFCNGFLIFITVRITYDQLFITFSSRNNKNPKFNGNKTNIIKKCFFIEKPKIR